MVLGMAAKNRKGGAVQIKYSVLIQDVKPWPPSQSLRSLRSVMLQWENGEKSSGSTNAVAPTLGSVIGEGKIEFSESFKLPVSLVRECVRGRDSDTFQKNLLEFNLYEPRRDKAQLLASAIVDLAEYGIVNEALMISVPMNCKRSFRNTDQPILSIKIEPIVKGRTNSFSKGGPLNDASLDRNGSGSVSSLMNEEYSEEAEVASFTDDDVSSQSSMAVSPSTLESSGGLPPQLEEQENSKGTAQGRQQENEKDSSTQLTSTRICSDLESTVGGHSHSISNCHNSNSQLLNGVATHSMHSSASSIAGEFTSLQANGSVGNNSVKSIELYQENAASNGTSVRDSLDSDSTSEFDNERQKMDGKNYSSNGESPYVYMQEVSKVHPSNGMDCPLADRGDILKHVKSVRSSSDSIRSNGLSSHQHIEVREGGISGVVQTGKSLQSNERKDAKVYLKDLKSASLDNKMQHLEQKLKMLEGELREAAALEAALYSVAAEHGSSISKVHAPARRLSRLYHHVCKEGFQLRRASVSRSIISGLILVAKACGNDVPRLTFWLSNSVVFRAIIWRTGRDAKKSPSSGLTEKNVARRVNKEVSPQLNWKDSFSKRKDNNNISFGSLSDWEDPHTFISALERVEGWIFSRVIESVWWQTLTPHMQLAIGKAVDRDAGSLLIRKSGRMPNSSDQDQGNFSLEHWKKAFKHACERLCPVRAAGHECGCLPVLARLIMEQCVARLDVAMFNALLRESNDEMPTDPVSDPISNSAVLPIPAGKASFGAGARLKNAIGNWSRWLSNLFGIDDDENPEDEKEDVNDDGPENSFKPFRLLNAFSDLMMLPKDMLLDGAVRKEVCPTFGSALIRKILYNFVPDEFCPDPVPSAVLEALDEEDPFEAREGLVATHPCAAPPPDYSPPSPPSICSVIGESGSQSKLTRTGSSVVRKSHTSDDELDELNSPLSSILTDGFRSSHDPARPSWMSRGNNSQCSIRYELLRDVWMSSE